MSSVLFYQFPVHHLLVVAHMVMTGIPTWLALARASVRCSTAWYTITSSSKQLFQELCSTKSGGRVSEWRMLWVHRAVNQALLHTVVADIGK